MEGIESARLRDRLNVEVKDGEESNLTPPRGKELNMTFREVMCDSLLFVSYGVLFFFSAHELREQRDLRSREMRSCSWKMAHE